LDVRKREIRGRIGQVFRGNEEKTMRVEQERHSLSLMAHKKMKKARRS